MSAQDVVDAIRQDQHEEDLWKNAHVSSIIEKNRHHDSWQLQWVCGRTPTSTVFTRILMVDTANKEEDDITQKSPLVLDVLQVLQKEIMTMMAQKNERDHLQYTAMDWLQLGAVWQLSNSTSTSTRQRTQRKIRLWEANAYILQVSQHDTLRVHTQPSRFPAIHTVNWMMMSTSNQQIHNVDVKIKQKPSAIMYDDKEDLGFLVVNKPYGVPSHATVDNGVENVLYQLQKQQQHEQQEKTSHSTSSLSLPQRLDIETSGLLLVSTKTEFASYMGKLLQQKSYIVSETTCDGQRAKRFTTSTTNCSIQKQYQCLVQLSSSCQKYYEQQRVQFIQELEKSNGFVTHYLDTHSSAPKTFVAEQVYQVQQQEQSDKTYINNKNNKSIDCNQQQKQQRWLKCVLRVLDIGPCQKLALKNQQVDGRSSIIVLQVRLELLTGRTHQIRGQFAAMKMPLVGDPLYNHHHYTDQQNQLQQMHNDYWDTLRQRSLTEMSSAAVESTSIPVVIPLALQCCSLSFPKPQWKIINTNNNTHEMEDIADTSNKQKRKKKKMNKIGRRVLTASQDVCTLQLDSSWWTDIVRPILTSSW